MIVFFFHSSLSSSFQIHDEEERKRVEDKRLKNRVAAEKSRKRKKEQTERLESDAARLRLENEQVINELGRLKVIVKITESILFSKNSWTN